MAVIGFVKFQVCLKEVNISFEPEFGNPRFETPKFFQLTSFSAEKPVVLNLFLSHLFFMLSSERGFSSSAFLTQHDFENPKKNSFHT